MAARALTRRRRRTRAATPAARTKAELLHEVQRLERRLAAAAKRLAALRDEQARALAAVRRAADRKLAVMMRELATLRHHEARAAVLERALRARGAEATGGEGRDDGEAPGTAR